MSRRSKYRFEKRFRLKPRRSAIFGWMAGTVKITGDIVSPEPDIWDAELGIAYRGENGVPVYYTGKWN